MNIIDIVSGAVKPQQNELANKIAVRSEMKRIENRVDQCIGDILNYYSSETDYINNNLGYGSYSPIEASNRRVLSQEDKDALLKKLEETIKSIPEKMKESLNDIFGGTQEEKSKVSDNTEDNSQETATASVATQQQAPQAAVSTSSIFGY